jgi:hypothetical protein
MNCNRRESMSEHKEELKKELEAELIAMKWVNDSDPFITYQEAGMTKRYLIEVISRSLARSILAREKRIIAMVLEPLETIAEFTPTKGKSWEHDYFFAKEAIDESIKRGKEYTGEA